MMPLQRGQIKKMAILSLSMADYRVLTDGSSNLHSTLDTDKIKSFP